MERIETLEGKIYVGLHVREGHIGKAFFIEVSKILGKTTYAVKARTRRVVEAFDEIERSSKKQNDASLQDVRCFPQTLLQPDGLVDREY